jgi:hypothetical protein
MYVIIYTTNNKVKIETSRSDDLERILPDYRQQTNLTRHHAIRLGFSNSPNLPPSPSIIVLPKMMGAVERGE